MSLIRTLTARRDLTQVSVEKPGFRLELRRTAISNCADMTRIEGFMFDVDGTLLLSDSRSRQL